MVAGCGDGFLFPQTNEPEAPEVNAALGEIRPVARPEGAPVASTMNDEARRIGDLGETVATLDATQPGLWLKTPLVSVEQSGEIIFGDKRLAVRLIPIDGPETGGSLISLEAMRAVDAPLTGFPKLQVFGS